MGVLPLRVHGYAWDTSEQGGPTSHPCHLTKALPHNIPLHHNTGVSPGAHRGTHGTMGDSEGQQLPRTMY